MYQNCLKYVLILSTKSFFHTCVTEYKPWQLAHTQESHKCCTAGRSTPAASISQATWPSKTLSNIANCEKS